jgi:hypothetical protein
MNTVKNNVKTAITGNRILFMVRLLWVIIEEKKPLSIYREELVFTSPSLLNGQKCPF